ncbi:MAG TPA: ribonuclease R [Thermodesulfovibrionales bacterium]|nr:ribonuclease R [Thermodesulfovibrionales bacterium]
MLNKETIIAFFREKTSRPLPFKEIASLMELSRPEARALKRLLREMLSDGEIILNRKGMYGPAEEMNLVSGYFEAHRDGYGFILPEKPGERDFFVPPQKTAGAMKGDRVMARIESWKKREARVLRILERAHAQVLGTLDIGRTGSFIKPKDRTVPSDLYVAPNDRGSARSGDLVIAEITAYPTDKRPPAARVVKVLKKPQNPADEVELIIDEFSLPRRFPKAAADAAKLLHARSAGEERREKRKDLRDLPTVTIDGERAKDFDDAVSIERNGRGFRLWVHIADVGHFVPWDSPLDLEARSRGTSVYFPDRVIPMLPKELSEDLCSLRPQADRFSFTVEMEFDHSGSRVSERFYPSLINSNERMTYTSVSRILVDRDETERQRYAGLLTDFELMGELCTLLRSRRFGRGSLDFDLPEPEVLLDLQGSPEAIIRAERNFAHMIIEEFMVAANEAVAEHIEDMGVPSIYRIHEEPDPMKLEGVLKVIRQFARTGGKAITPKGFAGLLASIKGTAHEEIISYIVLRSLKQARYSATNVGHFGLASGSYTHFTSPIRRYPDLVVHRILREILTKKVISGQREKELETLLPDIAFSSSRRERLADDAENTVIRAMRCWFMKDKVGESFEGKIVGISPYGLKMRLNDWYVEGFLHVSYMTDDFYEYNDRTLRFCGRHTNRSFRIGQDITVRVDKVDLEEREIVFGL